MPLYYKGSTEKAFFFIFFCPPSSSLTASLSPVGVKDGVVVDQF